METESKTVNGTRLSKRMGLRRKQICDVAAGLLAENGYQATTLEMIAEELGYSKPNLYHYFKSKESIIFQLIEDLTNELYEGALKIVEGGAASEDELIRRLIISGVEILCSHPESRVLWAFEAGLHNTNTINSGNPFAIRPYFKLFESVFDKGKSRGLFKPVEDSVVSSLIMGVIGQVPRWYDPKGPLSPRQVGEKLSDIVISGLLKNVASS